MVKDKLVKKPGGRRDSASESSDDEEDYQNLIRRTSHPSATGDSSDNDEENLVKRTVRPAESEISSDDDEEYLIKRNVRPPASEDSSDETDYSLIRCITSPPLSEDSNDEDEENLITRTYPSKQTEDLSDNNKVALTTSFSQRALLEPNSGSELVVFDRSIDIVEPISSDFVPERLAIEGLPEWATRGSTMEPKSYNKMKIKPEFRKMLKKIRAIKLRQNEVLAKKGFLKKTKPERIVNDGRRPSTSQAAASKKKIADAQKNVSSKKVVNHKGWATTGKIKKVRAKHLILRFHHKFLCPKCKEGFTRRDNCRRHMRDQHPKTKLGGHRFQCRRCKQRFKRREDAEKHIRKCRKPEDWDSEDEWEDAVIKQIPYV